MGKNARRPYRIEILYFARLTISRIRWNTQVYQKGEDGNWILLHIETLMKKLQEGETLELPEVYIGLKHKHRTRLILYRLTQKEWDKRLIHHKK